MIIDLHNHTTLCNHANGSIEEYVIRAIECKIDTFGFSDHAPMDFDKSYRMSFDDMQRYTDEVLHVKSKYADKIEILLAYEVDYLPGYMDSRVLDAKVDYLIGSVHFIDDWGFDNPEFIGRYKHKDINHIWREYFKLIEDMASSRLFDIVGHIDLIKVFKFLPTIEIKELAYKALEAIKESDMVLELNVAGYRKPIGEPYPSKEILQMAYSMDIPITFGSDAHEIQQIGLFRDEIQSFAKSVGYTQCATFRNRKRTMVNF